MALKEVLTIKDPLSLYLWKAAVNAADMREVDLREMIKTDPKHAKILEESIRAKRAKDN